MLESLNFEKVQKLTEIDGIYIHFYIQTQKLYKCFQLTDFSHAVLHADNLPYWKKTGSSINPGLKQMSVGNNEERGLKRTGF